MSGLDSMPRHSVSVAGAVVRGDGRGLAVRRADNGRWELPGGVLEIDQDRAAFEAHEQQPHTRHFLGEREKFVTETEVTFLERLGGKV